MPLSLEQLEKRSHGIAASELSAIAGINPHQSPLDVWKRKAYPTQVTQQPTTPDQLRGIHLEPAIVSWIQELYPTMRVSFPGTVPYAPNPLLMATPDGLVQLDEHMYSLEIKCPRFAKMSDWCPSGEFPRSIEVPSYILPQVTCQMACLGVQDTIVAALLGDELRIMTVGFDSEFWDSLRELAERFWRDFVLPKRPPPIDGSAAWHDYLGELHPRNQKPDLLIATEPARQAALALDTANAKLKEAKDVAETARSTLKSIIGEHEGITFGAGGKVTWKNNPDSCTIDYAGILADYGIIPTAGDLSRHTTTRPGPRVFRINLQGNNL